MTAPLRQPLFIKAREVAETLQLSYGRFLQAREALENDKGFPEPMPHSNRPLLWRRDRVEAWIEEQGNPRATVETPRPAGKNIILMEEARRL